MATLEYIISIIGGGLLFAFIMMLLHGANSDPAEMSGLMIFTGVMFVLGIGMCVWSLS